MNLDVRHSPISRTVYQEMSKVVLKPKTELYVLGYRIEPQNHGRRSARFGARMG